MKHFTSKRVEFDTFSLVTGGVAGVYGICTERGRELCVCNPTRCWQVGTEKSLWQTTEHHLILELQSKPGTCFKCILFRGSHHFVILYPTSHHARSRPLSRRHGATDPRNYTELHITAKCATLYYWHVISALRLFTHIVNQYIFYHNTGITLYPFCIGRQNYDDGLSSFVNLVNSKDFNVSNIYDLANMVRPSKLNKPCNKPSDLPAVLSLPRLHVINYRPLIRAINEMLFLIAIN